MPSGDSGEQVRHVSAFAELLAVAIDVPVVPWDESYSTLDALDRRAARGGRRVTQAVHADAEAAAVILESWLASDRYFDGVIANMAFPEIQEVHIVDRGLASLDLKNDSGIVDSKEIIGP